MDRRNIPELGALEEQRRIIRLPPEIDIAVTTRVMRLIDTVPFRRLKHISQLGLVSLVYPGANHSRWEHSLGVYRLALRLLNRLSSDERFCQLVSDEQAELFLLGSLLHDIGHWPYCHPLEDMALAEIPRHENLARRLICEGSIAELIDRDWKLQPTAVADLIAPARNQRKVDLLSNMLSGPIDIDKMDYLVRDSFHAGVPYGKNFDQQRLISSMCLGENEQELAIVDKGRTAAEMMVFARYVMFSEVYWHHAVRSGTAMLQRAVFRLRSNSHLNAWQSMNEAEMVSDLRSRGKNRSSERLLEGIFGAERCLYKRLCQFNYVERPEMHSQLARKPFEVLVRIGERFSELASAKFNLPIDPDEVLIDAPPVKLEVQFRVQVKTEQGFKFLGDVSPVVQTLATRQFDDYVKKVRVFVAPRLKSRLDRPDEIQNLLQQAIAEAG
jgi:HD superfamily phosphohydrolase